MLIDRYRQPPPGARVKAAQRAVLRRLQEGSADPAIVEQCLTCKELLAYHLGK